MERLERDFFRTIKILVEIMGDDFFNFKISVRIQTKVLYIFWLTVQKWLRVRIQPPHVDKIISQLSIRTRVSTE